MIVGYAKSYCVVGGGDHSGKKIPESANENISTRSPCRRLFRAPAILNLKKTQSSCGPLQSLLGVETAALKSKASRSAEDLFQYTRSFGKNRSVYSDIRRGPMDLVQGAVDAGANTQPQGQVPARLRVSALRACLLLMLGAWRARRAEARALRGRLNQMKLQVASLRALNKAEAERAGLAHREAGKARVRVDSLRHQLDALRMDHEAALEASGTLETRLAEQRIATENLRNELQLAHQEATALDQQLQRERAKLGHAREQRAQLAQESSQVQTLEQSLQDSAVELREAGARHEREAVSARQEIEQLAERCKALEEAVQSEQLSNSLARQALAENVQELCRARAHLESLLVPRCSLSRLLAVLRAPLELVHALYLTVCPFQFPGRPA